MPVSPIINLDEYRQSRERIDVATIRRNADRQLATGLIAPAVEDVSEELAAEHAAEPIKSMEDIKAMSRYFVEHGKYRDNMLFIVGINFGLRISDLRSLRFSNLINDNFTFKDSFPIFEKKTRNTRTRKINRYITINSAVIEAVMTFLDHTPNVHLSDYLFRSESNHGGNLNRPIDAWSINRILKSAANAVGINSRVSTHTLRKTFGYHQMIMSGNNSRKLLLLQKMFNHASPAQTLDYIGITYEEIEAEYRKLNLGSDRFNYLVDSDIQEQSIIE